MKEPENIQTATLRQRDGNFLKTPRVPHTRYANTLRFYLSQCRSVAKQNRNDLSKTGWSGGEGGDKIPNPMRTARVYAVRVDFINYTTPLHPLHPKIMQIFVKDLENRPIDR